MHSLKLALCEIIIFFLSSTRLEIFSLPVLHPTGLEAEKGENSGKHEMKR